MCSMVMSRTSSRVYGYLMKMNMYSLFVYSNIVLVLFENRFIHQYQKCLASTSMSLRNVLIFLL